MEKSSDFPQGWYDDPHGSGEKRWWDGEHWAKETVKEVPATKQPEQQAFSSISDEATKSSVCSTGIDEPLETSTQNSSGWYKDPNGRSQLRWWDGSHWTANTKSSKSIPDPVTITGEFWWEGKQWSTSADSQSGSSGHAGWYPDPKGEAELRWWDGMKWLDKTTSKAEAAAENPPFCIDDYPAIRDLPVLRNWKTSVGYSILGCFLGLILVTAINLVVTIVSETYLVHVAPALAVGPGTLTQIIYEALCLIYALAIYPSYFKEKPLFKSAKIISCANLLFGAVLFGCLWNYNLTISRAKGTPKKGCSYIVCAISSVVTILLALFTLFMTHVYLSSQMTQYEPGQYNTEMIAQNQSADSHSTPQINIFQVPAIGASFAIPAGWIDVTSEANIPEEVYLFLPMNSDITAEILFSAVDEFGYSSKETNATMAANAYTRENLDVSTFNEDYVIEYLLTDTMDDIETSSAKLATINNCKYWMVTASGTIDQQEYDYAAYLSLVNGYSYTFVLVSTDQPEEVIDELNATLRKLVESVNYN